MAHARAAGVKVIAIGDSGQLPSVQAGGWLGSLTERLGSHELREVMRQRDPRERQLLAQVRRGDPTDYLTEKSARGHVYISIGGAQGQGGGERAAITAWRERQAACPWGQAVLIVRENDRRERLNALIRSELKREGQLGESIHIGGCEFAVGDRVVARRNDRERAVDNGMRGTLIAVDPTEKEVVVRTDGGAQRRLDASYVAEHLQHAYVLTAHTAQGATVEWAGVVGRPEDFTRNWSYTALSRAREPTELFILDTPTERELDRIQDRPRPGPWTARRANPDPAPEGSHALPRRRGPRARPRRRAHPWPGPSRARARRYRRRPPARG
jgi:ATP-dependent exoDNAse (exonuclease V) alpha subunit